MAEKKSGGKPGYAGRISNSGTQKVEAVFPADNKKGTSSVIKGEDLRDSKTANK